VGETAIKRNRELLFIFGGIIFTLIFVVGCVLVYRKRFWKQEPKLVLEEEFVNDPVDQVKTQMC